MIDGHEVGRVLDCDKCGHALEQEIEVVAAEKGVETVSVRAAAGDRLHRLHEAGLDIPSASKRIALDVARSHVVDDDRRDGIELVSMRLRIGSGTQQAQLLAAEEDETNRAAGARAGGCQCPRGFQEKNDVSPVVQTTCAEIPRVKMGAHDHKLVGRLPPQNVGDDVVVFEGTSGLVREANVHPDGFVAFEESDHPLGVLAGSQGGRHDIQTAVYDVYVAIQQAMRSGRHEEHGCGSDLGGLPQGDGRVPLLVPQVEKGTHQVGPHKQDLAFCPASSRRIKPSAPVPPSSTSARRPPRLVGGVQADAAPRTLKRIG